MIPHTSGFLAREAGNAASFGHELHMVEHCRTALGPWASIMKSAGLESVATNVLTGEGLG